MDGVHAHLAGFLFHKGNCLAAISAAAVCGYNSTMNASCAESGTPVSGQYRFGLLTKNPNFSREAGSDRNLGNVAGTAGSSNLSLLFRQFADHRKEFGLPPESRHVIHRFVQSVLRLDRSSRFDG